MKRVLGIVLVLCASAAVLVLGTGASDGGGAGYRVRAIFNNAFSVIPGEDLKIAGVKVGKIESLDVTKINGVQKAAVVLRVDLPGFGDWRKDASCTIRPQSLIGEKFVECVPTQPRPAGAQEPPLLPEDPHHKGEHLLPSSQTTRPIDLDLLNNILRLPYRQRLSIIINELGTGLAGRGQDLNAVIRNADPALEQTDKVLHLLAGENEVLSKLARDSDASLAPLARERNRVADFVVKAGDVARATAEKRVAFEAGLSKLPAFLRQLKPTMVRLGALSDEMTPVLQDLGAQAPAINRFIISLGPFSQSATPSLTSLGDASKVGRVALVKSKPIVRDLRSFGTQVGPLSSNLSRLLGSFETTGGIERLMDFLFYSTSAINGYDSYGHYLRAQLLTNLCSTYADPAHRTADCAANFVKPVTARSAAQQAAAGGTGAQPSGGAGKAPSAISLPSALLPAPEAQPATPSVSPRTPRPTGGLASPSGSGGEPGKGASRALLDYLLGGAG